VCRFVQLLPTENSLPTGADAYLQQPVNLNELEVILQHIENRLTLTG